MADLLGLWRRLDRTGAPMIVARLVLGGMFIYMGTLKIMDPVEFLKQIREYHMAPQGMPLLLNAIAIAMPWVEVVCGLFLLAGVALRGAAALLLGLMLVFTYAVAARAVEIYRQGELAFCAIAFDCGCGTGVVNICGKLVENTLLTLLCVLVLISCSRRLCLRGDLFPRA